METHMFRIKFLVDDRHLPTVLSALAGKTRRLRVVPVSNAEPLKNGHVREKAGNVTELFMQEVHKRKITELEAQKVKSILTDMGNPTSSYSHILNKAIVAGLLKKGVPIKGKKSAYTYAVVPVK